MGTLNNSAVLLFPWPSIGKALIEEYRNHNYRIALVLPSTDKPEYKDILDRNDPQIEIFFLKDSAVQFWEDPVIQFNKWLNDTQTIINCVGHDFIRIQVQGEGEDWIIRATHSEQKRFAFIDLLLKNLNVSAKKLWINLVYGKAGQPNEQTFCDSRYGIMGFSNVLKMMPGLSGLRIVDICLTYLQHKNQPGRTIHCQHCSAEKFHHKTPRLDKPQAIASFVFEQCNLFLK